MKKLKKHKKALIIIGSIIIIILLISPVTNIYCTLKFKKSKVININSEFEVINDELYEITHDGEYYLHNFDGKPEKVDLINNGLNIFISEEFHKKILSFLSDKDIELMNNSKSASYSKDAAYIDEFGSLFVKGPNTYGELGKEHCDPYFGNNINKQFKRIK